MKIQNIQFFTIFRIFHKKRLDLFFHEIRVKTTVRLGFFFFQISSANEKYFLSSIQDYLILQYSRAIDYTDITVVLIHKKHI